MIGLVDEETIALGLKVGIRVVSGSINKRDGRVRLFVKGRYPAAFAQGYALRSRVVWWLHTGKALVGGAVDLHHKNEVRADDRFDNLELLDHGEHSRLHNPCGEKKIAKHCEACGIDFLIDGWRVKELGRGRFCSQQCYHAMPRRAEHAMAISRGLSLAYMEGRR